MDLNNVEAVRTPGCRDEVWPLSSTDAILAGGTWLFSEPQPAVARLVDITGLGWPPVTLSQEGVELAATCTVAELGTLSTSLPSTHPNWSAAPLFAQCCTALLASFKVWGTATVGGNICRSFAAASMVSLAAALDAGVTWIDLAPVYGAGKAEEIAGQAIRGRRDEVQICTKVGLKLAGGVGAGPAPLDDEVAGDGEIHPRSGSPRSPVPRSVPGCLARPHGREHVPREDLRRFREAVPAGVEVVEVEDRPPQPLGQAVSERGLARPAAADNRDHFAHIDIQIDALEHVVIAVVLLHLINGDERH